MIISLFAIVEMQARGEVASFGKLQLSIFRCCHGGFVADIVNYPLESCEHSVCVPGHSDGQHLTNCVRRDTSSRARLCGSLRSQTCTSSRPLHLPPPPNLSQVSGKFSSSEGSAGCQSPCKTPSWSSIFSLSLLAIGNGDAPLGRACAEIDLQLLFQLISGAVTVVSRGFHLRLSLATICVCSTRRCALRCLTAHVKRHLGFVAEIGSSILSEHLTQFST